jgi:hypothetical protein
MDGPGWDGEGVGGFRMHDFVVICFVHFLFRI